LSVQSRQSFFLRGRAPGAPPPGSAPDTINYADCILANILHTRLPRKYSSLKSDLCRLDLTDSCNCDAEITLKV